VGKTAYDATLPTALGGPKSLSQAREGKKAVLFFWATWCPHCHDEITRLNRNMEAITAKGVKIVLVSIGETKEDVAAYLKRNAVVLDSFLDEDNALQGPYDLVGVPPLVFVDEKGIIREVRHDFPDNYGEYFTAK
jgi:peroxiredoxin